MSAPGGQAAFSRPVAIGLILLVGGSLMAALLFGMIGEPAEPTTPGANAFSKSALGHKAFIRLMQQEEIPVLVSRFRSGERASDNSMLMVLEPQVLPAETDLFSEDDVWSDDEGNWDTDDTEADPEDAVTQELNEMLSQVDVAVVVLPKRVGFVSEDNPQHIESSVIMPEYEVEPTLSALRISGSLVRLGDGEPDESDDGDGSSDVSSLDLAWSMDVDLPIPDIADLQLIDSADVSPIISTPDGIFFGRVETHYPSDIYVVSDPDVFATHGIVRGDNASFALGLVNYARAGRTVVVDETIHGYVQRPSLARELTRAPLVLATIQVLLILVLALWAGIQRFGSARPEHRDDQGGQLAIIDDTAEVLEHSGHGGSTVGRYLQMVMRDVEKRLHAPPQRDYQARMEWLEKTAEQRGVGISLATLREQVRHLGLEVRADKDDVEIVAGRIFRWREEMLRADGRSHRI